MKLSPLQLEPIKYSDVVIRANPEIDMGKASEQLSVAVSASIYYNRDGDHFASVTVEQKDESFAYLLEVTAFTMFSLSVDGCREAYKQQFNPAVIGVNVARVIYSSARDLIASITARSPYETARIPSLMIEPGDIRLHFEKDSEEDILRKSFGMSEEQILTLRQRKAELAASSSKDQPTKSASKKSRALTRAK